MDTRKYRYTRNSDSQPDVILRKFIGFIFVVSFAVTGCFDSNTESTPAGPDSGEYKPRINELVPSNHTDNVSNFLHAPGKDTPFTSWCTACHGQALNGDVGPDCYTCHNQVWTETTPPGSGGRTSNAPSNHTDNIYGFLHAAGKDTPYSHWCTACHGSALEGDLNAGVPTCTACHDQVWTETPPTGGGSASNPPPNHTDNVSGFIHATDKQTPWSSWCTVCHGDALEGNPDSGAPSCTACHGQEWTETAPPGGGGSGSNPPANHTDNVSGFLHAAGKDTPYSNWCTVCHGSALEGDLDSGAPSCTACHGQVWTETTPPGGGGSGSNPPANHTDNVSGFFHAPGNQTPWSSWCTVCHGKVLEGNPDSGAPSCTACHGQVWTETAPPGGGSSSNPPSNHTNSISGFLHAPGNDTPWSSWCSACHGDALEGDLDSGAPSCTACHSVVWTEAAPPAGGSNNPPSNHINNISGFLHAPGNDTPFGSWCSACHGDALQGNLDSGAPSCTACHSVLWTETGGGSTGNPPANHTNNVSGFFHAPGNETPYSSWCSGCHGSNLQGDLDLGAPSCTACHAQLWSESPGAARDLPSSHTDSQHGFLHAPGKNAPFTNLCTVCHGADLRGYVAPSCYSCHGRKWNESGP